MSAPTLPGLTIMGVAGFGAHGPIYLARWDGRDVTVREVRKGTLPRDAHLRRFSRMREMHNPHLARLVEVSEAPAHFTLLSEFVAGPTLSAMRAGGAGLSLPEGWRLLADVAQALAELHRHAIVHADLSPANVLVRSTHPYKGRAVVIDLGGEEVWELGTVGFRAPEIAEGYPASAASDVWSSARIALWSVREEDRLRFGEQLRGMLDPEPGRRPSAAEVATLAQTRAADIIDLPDEARLASGHLRAKAADSPTTRAPKRTRGARRRFTDRSVPASKRTGSQASSRARLPARRGRHRRRSPRAPRAAVAYVGAVIAGTVLAATVLLPAPIDRPPPPAGSPPSVAAKSRRPPAPQTPPWEAVIHLTRTRDAALADHDLELLESVTIPGSAAAEGDRRLLRSFRRARPAGLRTNVSVSEVQGPATAPIVEVSLAQLPFTWDGGARDGVQVGQLPPRCARVHLEVYNANWRVSAIERCVSAG